MIISSILHRELLKSGDPIHILWTPTDNTLFRNFIEKCLGNPVFFEFDNTYLGLASIDIIICNSRISHLEKSIESAKYFHCPILIVDHEPKSSNISVSSKDIPTTAVAKIAINDMIAASWQDKYDKVLQYEPATQENIREWNTVINDLIRSIVKVKEDV